MPGSTALASLFPAPRPVTLAGREYLVAELRLRDLADLEMALADIAPSPDPLPDPDDDPDPETRFTRVGAALKAAMSSPPACGSDAWRDLLATDAGVSTYLWFVLVRSNPGLSAVDVVDLAGRMTSREWADLDRLAWGRPAWHALRDELHPGLGGKGGPSADWGEVVDALSRERCLTYDQLGDCTISQIRRMSAHGKADVSTGPVFAGKDPWASVADYETRSQARRRVWVNGRLAALGREPLPPDAPVSAPDANRNPAPDPRTPAERLAKLIPLRDFCISSNAPTDVLDTLIASLQAEIDPPTCSDDAPLDDD